MCCTKISHECVVQKFGTCVFYWNLTHFTCSPSHTITPREVFQAIRMLPVANFLSNQHCGIQDPTSPAKRWHGHAVGSPIPADQHSELEIISHPSWLWHPESEIISHPSWLWHPECEIISHPSWLTSRVWEVLWVEADQFCSVVAGMFLFVDEVLPAE